MRHQLNLLPPKRKEQQRGKTYLLAITKNLKMLAVTLGSFTLGTILLITGIWLLIFFADNSKDEELQQEITAYVKLKKEINNKNERLKIVRKLGERRVVWSDLLLELMEIIPPNTTISSLDVSTDTGILKFSGKAPNRNTLVILEDKLNQLSWVQEVFASQSNYLKRQNPDYEFKLRIDNTNDKSMDVNDIEKELLNT